MTPFVVARAELLVHERLAFEAVTLIGVTAAERLRSSITDADDDASLNEALDRPAPSYNQRNFHDSHH